MLATNEKKICSVLGISEADFRRQQRGGQASLNTQGSGKSRAVLGALQRAVDAAGENDEVFAASLREARDAIDQVLATGSSDEGTTLMTRGGRSMVKIPAIRT